MDTLEEKPKRTKKMSLKNMSEEEKKERKTMLQREYMRRRRQTDPEFLEQQREYCRTRQKNRVFSPEELEKHKEYQKIYYEKIVSDKSKLILKVDEMEKELNKLTQMLTKIGIIS